MRLDLFVYLDDLKMLIIKYTVMYEEKQLLIYGHKLKIMGEGTPPLLESWSHIIIFDN